MFEQVVKIQLDTFDESVYIVEDEEELSALQNLLIDNQYWFVEREEDFE